MASVTGLTIDDFEKLPDALALNHELVDGELGEVSGNTGNHNTLREWLTALLLLNVDKNQLGRVLAEQEYDFQGNAHGPDVTYFGREKTSLYDGNLRVQRFVPDLAIEIVSQNDQFEALMKKAQRYRECGVKEVWIFSIEMREAYAFSNHKRTILGADSEFRPDLIPGFSIRIGDLLDRL
jgi:Uma2 family endonuclease